MSAATAGAGSDDDFGAFAAFAGDGEHAVAGIVAKIAALGAPGFADADAGEEQQHHECVGPEPVFGSLVWEGFDLDLGHALGAGGIGVDLGASDHDDGVGAQPGVGDDEAIERGDCGQGPRVGGRNAGEGEGEGETVGVHMHRGHLEQLEPIQVQPAGESGQVGQVRSAGVGAGQGEHPLGDLVRVLGCGAAGWFWGGGDLGVHGVQHNVSYVGTEALRSTLE